MGDRKYSNVEYKAGFGIYRQFEDRFSDNIEGNGKSKWDLLRSPDFKLVMWLPLDGVFNSNLRLPAPSLSTLKIVEPNSLIQFTKTNNI